MRIIKFLKDWFVVPPRNDRLSLVKCG